MSTASYQERANKYVLCDSIVKMCEAHKVYFSMLVGTKTNLSPSFYLRVVPKKKRKKK